MNFNRFFNFETKTIASGAGILAISTILSGGLGFIGDFLLAKKFGAGPLDIYFAAFRVPDLIYNILITGGVIVSFLPLFSEYLSQDEKKAWDFATNCLNIFSVLSIFLCFFLFLFSPMLVRVIVPGFSLAQQRETIFLTRLLLFSPILFGISSIFSGILQYFNRFLVYGSAPLLYNLGIISGILFLTPHFGILGVVFGVILGAVLHFLIQIPPVVNCGFRYKLIFKFRDISIKRFFLLTLPRIFGISAQQINLMVITAIASTLPLGSLTIFTFSNTFQNFIIGIFGTSFAIAAFPNLSKSLAESKGEEFLRNFSSIFRQILYLIIPLSVFTFLLRNEIIILWLRHGKFSLADARLAGASLGLFSLGLFASSLIPLIFRAFFAFQDTKTPTFLSIFAVLFNIILSLIFVFLLSRENHFQAFLRTIFNLQGITNIKVLGLPLAFSLSSIFQFLLLFLFLRRKEPWKQ